MIKVTKNERISTLEDAVAMNWSDMKKIETKISRAMTDMATRISNISLQLEGQQRQIHLAADSIGLNKQAIIMLENKAEPKPQLKQLDQSIFDGLDENWRFAAVDGCTGRAYVYEQKPHFFHGRDYWRIHEGLQRIVGHDYDASNWQNSLIEREPELQLKQLDQSVFDGLDEKWKSAATNTDGKAYLHNMPKSMMYFNHSSYGWCSKDYDAHEMQLIGDGFDPSGFAVGFIERDTAKELLEVDLSSELTGSDYFYSNITSALLESGSKLVVCFVSNLSESDALSEKHIEVILGLDVEFNDSDDYGWQYAVPINNQGEPLTQAEAGL